MDSSSMLEMYKTNNQVLDSSQSLLTHQMQRSYGTSSIQSN
jgi:hypothetical protein